MQICASANCLSVLYIILSFTDGSLISPSMMASCPVLEASVLGKVMMFYHYKWDLIHPQNFLPIVGLDTFSTHKDLIICSECINVNKSVLHGNRIIISCNFLRENISNQPESFLTSITRQTLSEKHNEPNLRQRAKMLW